LYDSLLDELEDDVVTTPGEVDDLANKSDEAEDGVESGLIADGDSSSGDDSDKDADGDSSSDAEEVLLEQAENWSDDPVRMYLTQMGEIPLLTRAQEIYLARQIETTRAGREYGIIEMEE
jgi:RNA polymerase primary sigma factor